MNGNFWNGKRVFVTGCTGLLGSWLSAELVSLGAQVVGLIRDQVSKSELIRSGTIHQIDVVYGDICNYDLIERAIAEYEVDAIFHLAAQTIVGIANRAPLSTFETNIKGTWVLMEAARRNPTVKQIVVASSDKAYGSHATLPYREDAPLQGQHPYDVSKSCADLIARTYAHTYQTPVAVTRFANLYGGGDLNWNRIVPGTMRSLILNERPIVRSDGTLKRDYIYVRDAVCGYLTVAEQLRRPEVRGQAFNFGMDNPLRALDMINAIIKLSSTPEVEPIILNQAKNEIQDQYLLSQKANRVLGWQPSFSLEQGLRETFDWYRAFLRG